MDIFLTSENYFHYYEKESNNQMHEVKEVIVIWADHAFST